MENTPLVDFRWLSFDCGTKVNWLYYLQTRNGFVNLVVGIPAFRIVPDITWVTFKSMFAFAEEEIIRFLIQSRKQNNLSLDLKTETPAF